MKIKQKKPCFQIDWEAVLSLYIYNTRELPENAFFEEFFEKMQALGVKTVICTDISKDGAMKGANLSLYQTLGEKYALDIIASGGVSSMEDVLSLSKMGLYGAIIGKAYYIGAIDLKRAIEVAKW